MWWNDDHGIRQKRVSIEMVNLYSVDSMNLHVVEVTKHDS